MSGNHDSNEYCRTCRFFRASHEECRRYPPTLVMSPSGDLSAAHPPVFRSGWCGEWAPVMVGVADWLPTGTDADSVDGLDIGGGEMRNLDVRIERVERRVDDLESDFRSETRMDYIERDPERD